MLVCTKSVASACHSESAEADSESLTMASYYVYMLAAPATPERLVHYEETTDVRSAIAREKQLTAWRRSKSCSRSY